MGANDATTSYGNGVVTIAVKRSVHDAARVGDGRARHTLAHELGHAVLGHAVLHDRVKMARRSLGNATPKWMEPFESAEHQVKVFAAAFLIDDAVAETLSSAEEISIQCGVSLESAEIYFGEMTAERDRPIHAANMRQKADEFRASVAPVSPKLQCLDEPCSCCGNRTLIPVDIKFLCVTCNTVSDRFQDGDSTGFP
jgi:hypothetical protein